MRGLCGVDEVCLSAKCTRLTFDSSSSAEVGSTAKPNAWSLVSYTAAPLFLLTVGGT